MRVVMMCMLMVCVVMVCVMVCVVMVKVVRVHMSGARKHVQPVLSLCSTVDAAEHILKSQPSQFYCIKHV